MDNGMLLTLLIAIVFVAVHLIIYFGGFGEALKKKLRATISQQNMAIGLIVVIFTVIIIIATNES
jgi:hypothetical protein